MRNLIIFGDTPFAERVFKYINFEGKDKVIAFTQEKNFISKKELQGLPVIPFEELDSVEESLEIMKEGTGKRFDPDIMEVFFMIYKQLKL